MTMIPPPGRKWKRTSVSLPKDVWDTLDRITEAENADRPPPERLSRERLMVYFLEWAAAEWDAEQARKSGHRPTA